jgi:F0F1-type ATP synthase assembly protein I
MSPANSPNKPDNNQRSDARDNPWVQIARYSQLALTLPAATVVGWLIGLGLDHWLHTTWIYIPGLLVGIFAGFFELIRTVLKDTNES